MLDEMQAEAKSLYVDGEYLRALAEFSVLAEIRARRKARTPAICATSTTAFVAHTSSPAGPTASASAPNCTGSMCAPTGGRSQTPWTSPSGGRGAAELRGIDAPSRSICKPRTPCGVRSGGRRRLLGAPATLRAEVDPAEFAQPLRHGLDLLTTIAELENETDANPSLTVDGLAPVSVLAPDHSGAVIEPSSEG